jgi:malate dehydrogenase (oxaloacetate-decarboxylating)
MKKTLNYHGGKYPGKIKIALRKRLSNQQDLSLAYTPEVAAICSKIHETGNVDSYTSRWNSVAILTNGTRVLGLGNTGPEAALPVMEGKSMIYKKLANIDAYPLCIKEKSWKKIVDFAQQIQPTYKIIHLEDITVSDAFKIQEKLEKLQILSFHDDRHGTAAVTIAGLINALSLSNRKIKDVHIVINGAGSAGIGIAEALLTMTKKITILDSKGIIYRGRKHMTPDKLRICKNLKSAKKGNLGDAIKGADVVIGISKPHTIKEKHLKLMNKNPVIFALSNPIPDIDPNIANKYGVVGTGRSDYANQINNSLAFPGIARGLLDAGAKKFKTEIIIAAARGIASSIKPSKNRIVPSSLDKNSTFNVAFEVFKECKKLKIATTNTSVGRYKKRLREIFDEN